MSSRYQLDRAHMAPSAPSTNRVKFRLGGLATDAHSVAAAREPSARAALWIADVSQVWAANAWLYFGFVLDRHSGRCLGAHFHRVLHPDLLTRAAAEGTAARLLERSSNGHDNVDPETPPAIVLTPRCYSAGVDFPHSARACAAESALARRFVAALRAAHLDDAEEDTWTSQREAIAAIRDWIGRRHTEMLVSA